MDTGAIVVGRHRYDGREPIAVVLEGHEMGRGD